MICLGLDASTTTCGYAFVEDCKPIDIGWIDVSKHEDNKSKAKLITDFIKNHNLYGKIERVNLESAVSGFAGGMTRQQVIIKLTRWNAVLEYVLNEDLFPLKVNLIGATTARKVAFGKARIDGLKPKEYVKSAIEMRYDVTKFLKLNKIGNVDKRMEDAYDALVLALN